MGKGLPPLPQITISWEIQLLLWAGLILIALLGAGLLFFVKRYIDKNDDHHKKVEGILETHGKKFSDTNVKFEELGKKITEEATKIDKAAASMKETQAAYQVQVNTELLDIHKASLQVKSDLTDHRSQLGSLSKDIGKLITTVEQHQNSLSLGAKVLQQQRDHLVNLKTEVQNLSKDVILIKNKKS